MLDRRAAEQAYAAWLARPDRPALEAEAAARGYRPATADDRMLGDREHLYLWRGALWVKSDSVQQPIPA